jgi:two-component system, cell cycle sensor histidine kinase PleC
MRARSPTLRSSALPAHISLEDVLDVSSGFIWCIDENLRFTFVSAGAFATCGLDDSAHIGRRFEDLGYTWPAESCPFGRLEAFEGFLACRRSKDAPDAWLRRNGKPVFKALEGFSGYIGTGVVAIEPCEAQHDSPGRDDVTSPNPASVSLNPLEIFHSAAESLTDGIALFGPNGKMAFCNTNFRKINQNNECPFDTETTFESIVRRNMGLGLIEDAVGREEAFLSERLALHRTPTNEPRVTHWTDGNVLLVRECRLSDGSTVVVNTDVTELSRRERALTEALGTAEQASRAKSAFLARMSHELRTPLNAIIGFSDLVLSEAFGPLGSERYRSYVGDVKSSGEHLLSLINDLLDLTGIESGRREFVFESHGPRDLVSAALRAVRPIGRRAGIRLRGSAPADLPLAWVDTRSMHQCLLNLLSNAIKATPRGGRVAISVGRRGPDHVVFSVSDTGKGMSRKWIDRVMRNSGPPGANYVVETDGAGLGLPITKSLIDVMGGRIEIDSAANVGTKVSLIVPAA